MDFKRVSSPPKRENSQLLLGQNEIGLATISHNDLTGSMQRSFSRNVCENEVSKVSQENLHQQSMSLNGSISSSSVMEDLDVTDARSTKTDSHLPILTASFMVNFIAFGIIYNFDQCLLQIAEHFQDSNFDVDKLYILLIAMKNVYGPLAAFFIDKYGCRQVTIYGSVTAAIGFLLSSVVFNMETLFITVYIISAFGLSLCCSAATVIIAHCFDKNRSLVFEFAFKGSFVGLLFFVRFTHTILNVLGWRLTFVVFAILSLSMAICGLEFRHLHCIGNTNKERKWYRKFVSLVDCRRFFGNRNNCASSTFSDNVYTEGATIQIAPEFRSLVDLPIGTFTSENMTKRTTSNGVLSPHSAIEITKGQTSDPIIDKAVSEVPDSIRKASDHLNKLRIHEDASKSEKLNIDTAELNQDILGRFTAVSHQEKNHWRVSLREFWKLMVNPAFCVLVLSNFILYLWRDVPCLYLENLAYEKSFGQSAVYVLELILDTSYIFGSILLAWIGDWKCVDPTQLYACCNAVCGLIVLGIVTVDSYITIALFFGALGFLNSSGLTINILVQQFSLNKFTKAYGLLLLLSGVADIVFYYWIADITMSPETLFYLAAGFTMLSGFMLIVAAMFGCLKHFKDDQYNGK